MNTKIKAEERKKLCLEIKNMIVNQLDLDIDPRFINNDQSIFGRGLELDLIDALELAVGPYKCFDITVYDSSTDLFGSVNAIADFIEANVKAKIMVNDKVVVEGKITASQKGDNL